MDLLHARLRGRDATRCFSVVVALGLPLCGLLLLLLLLAPRHAAAQEDKQGSVIVQFDDHAQMVRTFTFTGDISGLDVLALSGLDVVTTSTSFGPVVCSIEGVGCPADDCFCNPTKYWAYSAWDGGAWQSYPVGAGSSVISQTGAVEGWRWGEFGAAQAPASAPLAAGAALDWLAARQVLTDGGFGGAGATVETLVAVGANGLDAGTWRREATAPSLADAARAAIAAYTQGGAAAAGKGVVGLAGAGVCLPPVTALPSSYYSPTLGAYSLQSGPNAWAMLGALALGQPVPPEAVAGLRSQSLVEGGWEWAPGWGADTNSTALAIQALAAAGAPITATEIVSGLALLKSAQNADGGFAYAVESGVPGESDTNSTAYALQALAAAGQDVYSGGWQVNGRGPIDYLLSMQQGDGSFAWRVGSGPNQLATQQVIPALLGRAQAGATVPGDAPVACPAVFLAGIQR
jgi:hypothetical protein